MNDKLNKVRILLNSGLLRESLITLSNYDMDHVRAEKVFQQQ